MYIEITPFHAYIEILVYDEYNVNELSTVQ
jgi:hypothetical protein